MRKIAICYLLIAVCAVSAAVAARTETAVSRQKTTETTSRAAAPVRATTARSAATNVNRDVQNRSAVTSRGAKPTTRTARVGTTKPTVARAATVRSAMPQIKFANISRAATGQPTQTFGVGYNACRDSYFTCMDQFCAHANDSYRRCICSSRLEEIKGKERALNQTAESLQNFKDLNIDAISKSGNEVKAMLNATGGETAQSKTTDSSDSASALSGISAVLSKAKSESLSTAGQLDIAGDINSIWATTDLTGGADIMSLSGEKLYNAVHAQCIEFAAANCDNKSTSNMVVSAYGMYIENDCTALSNSIAKKTNAANDSIRATEYEMNDARLENYNAHNSASINECIAQVRKDITSNAACGEDYVHCLDFSGQYLNRDTGEPIYSANFYQLELSTSLAGDVVKNQTNRMLIAELNRKKESANRGLDTCRDLADEVWDEFMRQAVVEIYQGQQARIRQVKEECIDVVNNCYDTQSKSLKDFSNVKEQLLLGSRLELSEQMCTDKLEACSNLYGGGSQGLEELVETMKDITDAKIAKDCVTTLREYVTEICAVPNSDTLHAYPYSCRVYVPGDPSYATDPECNTKLTYNIDFSGGSSNVDPGDDDIDLGNYNCPTEIKYTSCSVGYYMWHADGDANNYGYDGNPKPGNRCLECSTHLGDGYTCLGGTNPPVNASMETSAKNCGDYAGSLYQKLVRYALQTCVRPSAANEVIPTTVLSDVNSVMDTVRSTMGTELSKECERLGGIWIDTPWEDNVGARVDNKDAPDGYHDKTGEGTDVWLPVFYKDTGANKKWGYCRNPS